ncbi:MAG: hypothetical protein A2408_00995 [Candidatus Yonathbacteria bacterium RIFOXYC1_FULL_52_10]|nr:MAG: hypothetical protein A2408_00995 [Candidatus Yonathbacteria bacterium RIFOXYC1_FULL_52_10]
MLALVFGQGTMAAVTCNSLPDGLDPVIRQAAESVVTVQVAYTLKEHPVVETYASGFVVNARGHVATSAHLLNGFRHVLRKPGMRYRVTLFDCRTYEAELLSESEHAGFVPDTAILKILAPPDNLMPVAIGNSDDLKKGDPVFAIGSPHLSNNAVVPGEVLETGVFQKKPPLVPLIQASTVINVGASGGALFDASGKVVGLTASCLGADTGPAGFACIRNGFFVPIDLVMKFARPFIIGAR